MSVHTHKADDACGGPPGTWGHQVCAAAALFFTSKVCSLRGMVLGCASRFRALRRSTDPTPWSLDQALGKLVAHVPRGEVVTPAVPCGRTCGGSSAGPGPGPEASPLMRGSGSGCWGRDSRPLAPVPGLLPVPITGSGGEIVASAVPRGPS